MKNPAETFEGAKKMASKLSTANLVLCALETADAMAITLPPTAALLRELALRLEKHELNPRKEMQL